jgi:hypothetical protein
MCAIIAGALLLSVHVVTYNMYVYMCWGTFVRLSWGLLNDVDDIANYITVWGYGCLRYVGAVCAVHVHFNAILVNELNVWFLSTAHWIDCIHRIDCTVCSLSLIYYFVEKFCFQNLVCPSNFTYIRDIVRRCMAEDLWDLCVCVCVFWT